MKIALLAQFYPPVIGGEERHVRNLAHYLHDHHDVVVITQGPAGGEQLREGIRVRTVQPATASLPMLYSEPDRTYAPPAPDPRMTVALRRLIREEQPDVVHAHNWIVNSVLPSRRSANVPVVLTLHDYSHACATKRYMRADVEVCSGPAPARCLSCCRVHYGTVVGTATYTANLAGQRLRRHHVDRIIAVSRAVARHNRLDDLGVPYEVIPNFVPDDLLTKMAGASSPPEGLVSEGYILFVGDLSAEKGVDVLLAAYQRLPLPRLPLLMVGRRTTSTPRELPEGATIAEAWDHPRVVQAFAHAAFAVAPSIWPDPCPTVVLEAMAAGRAVVTTPLGGIADMVRQDREGLVVAPGDATGLADALERLSKDRGYRDELGTAGRTRVHRYLASTVLPRIEQVYTHLVHGR
ncbi:glycosyltransferase family 4 protein [Frankia sp. AgPm24]|uniref:glycosyltransferase family 4 protein n=1 Tax=Frankia sp. AgPm24 TaxID=631128 RepID=UPI00200E0D1F|nr:glycosyltransferase family 4 protein [Frankia sp. AgPm24]MCK9925025.1 glycosyltransferase family 4 protein [Frankia sp. AgPm24]